MATAYSDLDDEIRETAHQTAIDQGLPPVIDDPVVLAPAVAAVADYFEQKRSDEKRQGAA